MTNADIQSLTARAKQGDAEAQLSLGFAYASGSGVEENQAEAAKWWLKSAEQGLAEAQFNLGLAYYQGEGVVQNQAEGMKWWRKAAAQGDAEAQNNLGVIYYFGKSVAQDKAEGVKWWRKAAEQNLADAQYNLGLAYFEGKGVAQDKAKAVEWWRKAVAQGDAQAQYNLGIAYWGGAGVAQDKTESMKLWRKAADQGFTRAQYNLGVAYFKGEDVSQDKAEGVKWLHKAAAQGSAVAQYDLGLGYYFGEGVAQDYAKAVEWWRKAAEQNLADAQYNLGLAYYFGEGVAQDQAEGVKWYRLAAERGLDQAQFNMGVFYSQGQSVAQDHTKAVEWWRKAAEQGHAEAQYSLGDAYGKGKGVAQDHDEGLKWVCKAAEQGNGNALAVIVTAFCEKRDYRAAYGVALHAATTAPRLKGTNALVYIAHKIKAVQGATDEDQVAWFEAFFRLYKAVNAIRDELFCGQAGNGGGDEFSEVAHYTSLKAMQSLVTPGARFRLNNADHMDDPKEGRVFLQLMAEYGIADCQARYYPALGTDSDAPSALSPAYVGSFVSVKKDSEDKDLLYLWCIHGRQDGVDAGGACLIFDRKKFTKTVPSQFGGMHDEMRQFVNEPAGFDEKFRFSDGQSVQRSAKPARPAAPARPPEPALYRIAYKAECKSELNSELEQLANALNDVKDALPGKDLPDALKSLVREILDSIRFLFKSNHYDWEKEVRVVEMRYGVEDDNNRAPDDNGIWREVKYYLELGQDFRCHEVIIGSNADNYPGWESQLKDKTKDVAIRQSKIPLRRR